MIKLVYCVKKRADLSNDAFYDYWLNNHGPLVGGVADRIGAKRYVQSHTVPTPINDLLQASRGLDDPYDGITEVWFESLESVQVVLADPSAQDALRKLIEDESTFVDFSRSRIFLTREHTIFDL